MKHLINILVNKYKIVPIVSSFILGILINEYLNHPWILASISAVAAIFLSIFFRKLSFLLFVSLGIAFAANTQMILGNNLLNYTNTKVDLEGVLYRSPQSRDLGSRLYLDSEYMIVDGAKEPVTGKAIIYSSENTKSLAYGDRVRLIDIKLKPIENFKNPGGFNLKKFYERQNIHVRGFVENEEVIISFGLAESYNPILHYIDSLRIKYGNFVRERYKSPESELLNAITIGEKSGIPPETREQFSKAGVAHVLAISGLHVGAVAIAFFFLIKWILKRSEYILLRFQVPRLAGALTILPIILYTAIAGFSTSTVRAFIMVSLYLLAIVIGKEEHRLNTLCAAALIILLWHPWSLFELSFQLSFSAVLAIILTHKLYPFKFNTLEDKFLSLLKTTIAATLVTLPLVASSFGILSLVSIPANLTIVPLVEFIVVPVSLMSFVLFLISPYIAEPLISINIYFIEMLTYGVGLFLKIPYSSLTVPPMNIFSGSLFIALISFLILISRYPRIKYVIPFVALGFIASLIYPIPGKTLNGTLEINIIDVGNNKSTVLLELTGGRNILLHGGFSKWKQDGYIEKTVVTDYILNQGISKIDLLLLSSTAKDHLEGTAYLTDKFVVEEILTNGDRLSSALWENINRKNIKRSNLSNYESKTAFGNLDLEIIRPEDDFLIEDSTVPFPVAYRLSYNNFSFLYVESLNNGPMKSELVSNYKENIRSKILYLSEINYDNSNFEFIRYVSPKIIILRGGKENTKLLEQYLSDQNMQTIILETAKVGTVTMSTDGEDLVIKSFIDNEKLLLK